MAEAARLLGGNVTGDTGQKARGISNPVAIGLLLIFDNLGEVRRLIRR
mgnify:CR=1 FL=1